MKDEFFKSDNHYYMVEGTKVVHVNTDGLINDLSFDDFIANDHEPPIEIITEDEFKEAVRLTIKIIGVDIFLNLQDE